MATTAEQIAAIEAALATGALTVRHADGRTVTYRGLDELEAILAGLRATAAAASGTATVRRILVDTGRGL